MVHLLMGVGWRSGCGMGLTPLSIDLSVTQLLLAARLMMQALLARSLARCMCGYDGGPCEARRGESLPALSISINYTAFQKKSTAYRQWNNVSCGLHGSSYDTPNYCTTNVLV